MLISVLKRLAAASKGSFSVPVLLSTILWAVPAVAQESIETIREDETESAWLIKQPEVKKALQDYKDKIKFLKYDEVVVAGGGCVQTGGTGRTWKRYIDPVGSNSDRLYHGRIWIPGATDGIVRISSIEGLPLVINKFPQHLSQSPEPDSYFLRLGYEDDNLIDNGYYPKNKNNGSDCALGSDRMPIEGTAWLKIRAIHHQPGDAPSSPNPRAPLDLWWDRVDDNFFPYMPDWWQHHRGDGVPNSTLSTGCDSFREAHEPDDFLILGRSPQCTMSDPDVDEANFGSSFCHAIGPIDAVHGHVNWGAVTYRGRIYYERKSVDGDYDWALSPMDDQDNDQPIEIGVSTGNTLADGTPQADGYPLYDKLDVKILALEFSSRETLNRIVNSPWWERFKKDLKKDRPAARRSVKGREAIVVGLFGLDNEHGGDTGARVELHPVWGLAIHTESDSTEDVWVILARNWGNEGSCSNGWDITHGKWQHNLTLPENKMKFFLTAKFAPTAVAADFHANYGNASSNANVETIGNGVLLTIQLPEPEKKKLFWGELHIKK
jgi:hypothetical protein